MEFLPFSVTHRPSPDIVRRWPLRSGCTMCWCRSCRGLIIKGQRVRRRYLTHGRIRGGIQGSRSTPRMACQSLAHRAAARHLARVVSPAPGGGTRSGGWSLRRSRAVDRQATRGWA